MAPRVTAQLHSGGTNVQRIFAATFGLTALLTPFAATEGARPAAAAVPVASLYVAESGTNALGAAAEPANTLTSTPVGSGPHFVALTPDGLTAFVSNTKGSTVTPVNLLTGTAGAPITVGQTPKEIAVNPSGTTAYVVNNGSNSVTPIAIPNLTAIGTATYTPRSSILVGYQPWGIAISPNGTTAWVTDNGTAAVTPINLTTGLPDAPIPVGLNPEGIAVSPDGSTVYVVNTGSNTLTPISTTTDTAGAPIGVGPSPEQVAISPDGLYAYVTSNTQNELTIVNLYNHNVSQVQLPAPSNVVYGSNGVVVSPDGSTVYVSSTASGDVYVVSTATKTVSATPIVLGPTTAPDNMAITPDQAPLASLTVSATNVTAGTPVTFSASGSTVEYGTIASYQWFFGDGTPPVTTVANSMSHTYTGPGSYQAMVLEEDSAGTSYLPAYTGQTMSRNVPYATNGLPQSVATLNLEVTGSPISTRTPMLFVADLYSGEISPIGLPTPTTPIIGSAVGVGRAAAFPAVTPDAQAVVATNYGDNTVTPLTLCPNANTGSVQLDPQRAVPSGPRPNMVAISPRALASSASSTEWQVLVADSGGNTIDNYVLTVNSSNCTASLSLPPINDSLAVSQIPVGNDPYGIAITPSGTTAYVTDSGTHVVTPVNLAAGTVGTPIPVGLDPQGIAVTPDGGTLYVVDSGSNTVTPVSTFSNSPSVPIPVGVGPSQIVISPDGSTAWVANAVSASISEINLITNQVTRTITMPDGVSPSALAITPDGSTLYASSLAVGAVFMFSTKTGELAGTPIIGLQDPVGMAITPDQTPNAKLSVASTTVPANYSVTFDASASTVAYGTITGYQFSFGDGTPPITLTSTATTTHTYAHPGNYLATVLEEDSVGTSYRDSFTGQTASMNVFGSSTGPNPMDLAGLIMTVVPGNYIPAGDPVLYVADFGGGQIDPLGIPPNQSPIYGIPAPSGSQSAYAAVTPDGGAVVVTDNYSNTLTPIAVCANNTGYLQFVAPSANASNEVQATGQRPNGVAISPVNLSGTAGVGQWEVYVANSSDNTVYQYVLTDNPSTCSASLSRGVPISASIIPVGNDPYDVAVTPSGATAYVTNTQDDTVTPINTSSRQPGVPIPVGISPLGLVVSPDGRTVYVANSGSGTVTPISTVNNTPGTPINVGSDPTMDVISPDGRFLYVILGGTNSLAVVNLSNSQVTTYGLPLAPEGIAISPDGSTVFISNFNYGDVIPFSTVSDTTGQVLTGFGNPVGMAAGTSP